MNVRNSLKDTVALSLVPNLGPVSAKRLIERFGSVAGIFDSPLSQLQSVGGLSATAIAGLKSPSLACQAAEEIAHASRQGVRLLVAEDPDYPAELKEIYAPPIVLYVKGDFSLLHTVKIAIVGSRDASIYGSQTASKIAKELSEAGVTVVSGMAMGIDSAAHEGALAAGGPTIAVLGSGLSRISAGASSRMAERIVEGRGALISEFPMRMPAEAYTFPVRNRIISGISSGVLVVEAKAKSGALITVDAALEQGREVYAVPGNADSLRSQGTLKLLKQGAKLVTEAQDILQDLSLSREGRPNLSAETPNLSADENVLLSFLDREPRHVDELISHANLAPKDAIVALSFLELKGFAKQLPGKNYVASR